MPAKKSPTYRPVDPGDAATLLALKSAARENRLTPGELRAAGVTAKSLAALLKSTHSGWLCEAEGQAVGFVVVDESTGELWAIAVHPAFEGQGIGSELLGRAEECLWAAGFDRLWLYTSVDPALRAHRFYLRHGWEEAGVEQGELRMEKPRAFGVAQSSASP